MMIEYPTPPEFKPGCLPRTSLPGTRCPLFGDKIEVIPKTEWPHHIGNISLRPYVKAIFDQDGVGCHDDKTEVLTETGWQRWADYDQRSALGTVNPVTHALEFQQPTAVQAYEYSGPLHYVEHRSMSFAVTPNHRMYLRKWNERQRQIQDTYEMCDADHIGWYARLLAAPSRYVGVEVGDVTVGEHKYSGDDFLALVALVASDGWAGGAESTWDRVSFCCFREDRIDMVRGLANRLGFREQPSRPGVFDKRNAGDLAAWFRANMFSGDRYRSPWKRIPEFVKCVNGRQVELFLNYFGDQHVKADGRRAFYTSSTRMADDLQELLMHLGRRSGICEHKARGTVMKDGRVVDAANCQTPYTVTEWSSDNLSVEKKKVGTEQYDGMVYCATVPNSILVTRRDRKLLISGNSCASESSTQALQIARAFANRPWVQLNPWYVYHTVSGGSDRGSSIDDNLEFLRENGAPPMELWGRDKGWRADPPRLVDEAAKNYRVDEYYDISTVEEFGTALLKGFPIVYGRSGHAIVAIELVSPTQFRYVNSWHESWGDGGTAVEPLTKINWSYGAWAVRTPTDAAT